MTAADLPLGLRLARAAGWNQTEADWERFLALEPDGGFVAQLGDSPVGTVTTCVFGAVAWVAMVLVDEPVRGRGIGRALVTQALGYLDRRGVRTVRLDATALGQPLYAQLGFVVEYQVTRFQGRPPQAEPTSSVQAAHPDQLGRLIDLDRAVTGTDRGKLLSRSFQERPDAVRVVMRGGRVDGFLMARPGTHAVQIGPCIARPTAGPALLADAWHRHAGRLIFADLPAGSPALPALARAEGLTVQRHLLRMRRGEPLDEHPEGLWVSSGPEKG